MEVDGKLTTIKKGTNHGVVILFRKCSNRKLVIDRNKIGILPIKPGSFGANIPLTQSQQQQLGYAQQQPLPHMMPLPAATPWNIDTMPWTVATKSAEQPGGVMQFSAQNAMQKRAQLHHKRKSNIVPTHSPKQFISEEKITAHFNGLHISSSHIHSASDDFDDISVEPMAGDTNDRPTTSGKCFTNLTYQDYQVTAKELEEKLKRANRITVCDEIKKLQAEQQNMSFLPNALLNRIERPCTALVLWQPTPVFELTQKAKEENILGCQNQNNMTEKYVNNGINNANVEGGNFIEPDGDIDDFIDNNNTCSMDFNNSKVDGMDTDL